jgi:peptidyl-prolyl cis-trans isomerase B (cyclophilin B)
MGGLVGCDRNTGLQKDHASIKRIEPANPDSGTEDNTPFEWPSDPSHPVLEIKISSPVASGSILIELMPELAPGSVVHVVELAEDGFYDGTTFHRVIPDFMLQGGDPNSRDRDPTNDGAGRAGRPIQDEFSKAPFLRGVVGMGNKGRQNSTSTQFFIMQADNGGLDGRYNTVGRVLDGLDLVDQLAAIKTDRTGRWGPKDRPIENIVIESVRPIGQVGAILAAMELEADAAKIALASGDAANTNRLTGGRPGSGKAGSNSANVPASLGGTDRERLEAEAR